MKTLSTYFVVAGLLGCAGQLMAAGPSLPAGCGTDATQFKVKTENSPAMTDTVPVNKARLIFVETLEGDFSSGPITRFAVDGNWVGATKGTSFFTVDVAPGTHQLCASRQSGAKLEHDNIRTLSAEAQAGRTFTYQFTIKRTVIGSPNMTVGPTGVPGSSMATKPQETLDTADLSAVPASEVDTLLRKAPRARSTVK